MKSEFRASDERFLSWTWRIGWVLIILQVLDLILWQVSHPERIIALGSLGVVLVGFVTFFFRDPNRAIPSEESNIVAPADGTIVGIEELSDSAQHDGSCKRISIFLSIFNVHINRSPFDGTVESIAYKKGQFLDARKTETSDLNESNTIRMSTSRGPMTVRQISGLVARRIVCKVEVGESLAKGEKFGMIKFGSRTELYLPTNAEICVKLKDKVKGGETILARFPE